MHLSTSRWMRSSVILPSGLGTSPISMCNVMVCQTVHMVYTCQKYLSAYERYSKEPARTFVTVDLSTSRWMRSSAILPSGFGTSSISVCSGISSLGMSCTPNKILSFVSHL